MEYTHSLIDNLVLSIDGNPSYDEARKARLKEVAEMLRPEPDHEKEAIEAIKEWSRQQH